MIISITHPPRQLWTWEYYRQNRTIKLDFMRRQWQALERFWKSDQKSTLIAGFWTCNEHGTSGGSKPVCIGDLRMGLISHLHHFKAECSLYLSMRQSKFPDEHSNVLFILSYMKGGSAGPWAMQKINSILYPANLDEVTWAGFISELDEMFADPNCQATAWRKLTTLHQGDSSVEELI